MNCSLFGGTISIIEHGKRGDCLHKILAALGAFSGAALIGRSFWERGHFVVEERCISTAKVSKELVLVFLTDVHNQKFGSDNTLLLAEIAAKSPDAILIGGDMIVSKQGRANLADTEDMLRKLVKIAPVCYAYGNHEARLEWKRTKYGNVADELAAMLKKYGVVPLVNSSVCIDGNVRISGLNLNENHYRIHGFTKLTSKAMRQKIGTADDTHFQILLAHTPVFADAYYRWGADLTLCGHFHGGVVRIPKIGGIITPQERLLHPFGDGFFTRGEQHLIVGRGLGTHSLNIRLNNRPQLLIIRLMPEFQPTEDKFGN